MKRFLQKSLFRLHSLLLLAVMFVVGGSAYAAEGIEIPTNSVSWTEDGLNLTGTTTIGQNDGTYLEIWGNFGLTITSDDANISRVEFTCIYNNYCATTYRSDPAATLCVINDGEGSFSSSGAVATWTGPSKVVKVGTINGSADITITKIVVYLEEETGNFIDFSYTSANGGDKGLYSINSDVLTFSAPVTVKKNLTIDGNNVTSATPDGNNLNVSFAEIDEPGVHTLTVPKGALQIGDDYNNEFSVNYTLTQDPNKLYSTFFFNGAGYPYSREGVNYTMPSGYDFQVGDTFTTKGVTFTFTNCTSGWFNSAQRLYVGQNTAFTIAAPEGYEITKIKFNTDDGQLKLNWVKGLTNVDDKNAVWTGNEESVGFSIMYDSKIQTIDVTCVKLAEVEYEVDIYKGTEMADDDWTVTVNGVDGTFKNMDTFTTGKNIQPTDVVAPHHDGYHEAEVEIEEMAGTMFITVTYDVFDPINYTVDFSDNAPVGATVTIDDQEFTGDDTYSVAKDLDYYSVTAVDAPAGWYADYSYNEGNHTFTFDFKQYINYSVVVEGAPAGQGGVVYNYETYGAGENVLPAKSELTASSVSAADVDGYAGTVSLDDHTFTVSYKKETIVIIPTSTASGVVGGINVSSQQENSEVNLYGSGTGYLKLTTSDLKIVKVQLVCKATSYTGSSNGGGANLYNLGQYVYVTDCDDPNNTITSDAQNVEWTGSAKSITFTATYDFHLSSIKVWVEEAEVEPRENVMALTAKEPNLVGNVNEVTSTISFDANVNTEGNHHGYDGSSTDVPDGVTMKDASGNNYTITAMRWWDNQGQVSISLEHGITTPGDYTLTIPEGVIPCVGNKANKELTFTWHVLTPAPAFPLQTVAYEVKSVADNKFVTLTDGGAALNEVAEGFTFTWSKNDEAFIVKDKDENRLGGDAEFWTVESLGGEQYAFVSKSAGTYMSVDGENVVLNANDAYAFTLNVWVDPALFGVPASALALDESGLYVGTYYADHAWTTEDAWVYVVTGIGANSQLQTQMVSGTVPANTGVLLYSPSQNSNIVIKKSTEDVAPIEGNLLDGTVEATDGVGGDGATYYVLSKRDGKLGFYWDPRTKDEGATLNNGAHKAYLRVPAAQASNKAAAYFFDFGEGTITGIDAVSVESSDAIFNLQGKRVSRENLPAGVYVKNGKKFIVK